MDYKALLSRSVFETGPEEGVAAVGHVPAAVCGHTRQLLETFKDRWTWRNVLPMGLVWPIRAQFPTAKLNERGFRSKTSGKNIYAAFGLRI